MRRATSRPSSPQKRPGFEIGLACGNRITITEEWAELERLVIDHDKPGVDLLLVTARGSDHNGQIFPAEEVVAEF